MPPMVSRIVRVADAVGRMQLSVLAGGGREARIDGL